MGDENNANPQTETKQIEGISDHLFSPVSEQPQPDQSQTPSEEEMLNSLSDEETIDLFIRGIMKEKGTDVGSEEMQNDIFNDLKTSLLTEIDRSLVSALPDDKLEELNKIALESGAIDPAKIAEMIRAAGIDTTEVVGITMARFRDIYLGKTESEMERN